MDRGVRTGVALAAATLMLLCLRGVGEAQTPGFDWETIGTQTYAAHCGICHQPSGQGIPSAFPPLAGHAPEVLARPGGRAYLARLVLYGLQGPIVVNGTQFDGGMPPWGETLSDAELAGVLDVVLHSWGNDTALPPDFTAFTPAEIAEARATPMSAEQVYAMREQGELGGAKGESPVAPITLSFTEDQADRGHAAYRRNCQDCHGSHLDDGEFGGAPLKGGYFGRHWGDGSVAGLYGFMRTKMPPDRPGKLNPETYADLTAFLLSSNGYTPGDTELPADPQLLEHMSMKRN